MVNAKELVSSLANKLWVISWLITSLMEPMTAFVEPDKVFVEPDALFVEPDALFVAGGIFVGIIRVFPTIIGTSVREKVPVSTWPARWRRKFVSVSAVTVKSYQPLLLVRARTTQLVALPGKRLKLHGVPALRLSVTVKSTGLVSEFISPNVTPPAAGSISEVISIWLQSRLMLPANRRWKPLGP